MVTIIERSGRTIEREYKLVNRNNLDYIVLDGLYYWIFTYPILGITIFSMNTINP